MALGFLPQSRVSRLGQAPENLPWAKDARCGAEEVEASTAPGHFERAEPWTLDFSTNNEFASSIGGVNHSQVGGLFLFYPHCIIFNGFR